MAKKKRAKKAPSKTAKQKPAKKKAAESVPRRPILVSKVHPPEDGTIDRLESFRVTFDRAIRGLVRGHFKLTGTTETVDKVVPNLPLNTGPYKRDFEVVLTGAVTGSTVLTLNLDGTPTGGTPPSPKAKNNDTYTDSKTWKYYVEAENTAERVRLLVPPELYAHVQAMERRDPGLVSSIVRSIFGSHDQSHFGVRRIVIELDTGAAPETAKGKAQASPWDKSCL